MQATVDGRWGRYGLGALVHTADTPLCYKEFEVASVDTRPMSGTA